MASAQGSGCPPIYSNTSQVYLKFADQTEVLDDLHTIAIDQGDLCGFDIWLRNNRVDVSIRAQVSFYATDFQDGLPNRRIAGPYDVSIPANHDGMIQVNVNQGQAQQHMWVGVIFPDNAILPGGFVGLAEREAELGSSHDHVYLQSSGNFHNLDGGNADIHIVVYSNAPNNYEDSTWGRVKSSYR